MKTLPTNTNNIISALFVVEQITTYKEDECEFCSGEGCQACKQKGKVDTGDIIPKQPLTEIDISDFQKDIATVLDKYGFKTDSIGEKETMINRLAKKSDIARFTAANMIDFATKIHNSVSDLNHTKPTMEDLKLWEYKK